MHLSFVSIAVAASLLGTGVVGSPVPSAHSGPGDAPSAHPLLPRAEATSDFDFATPGTNTAPGGASISTFDHETPSSDSSAGAVKIMNFGLDAPSLDLDPGAAALFAAGGRKKKQGDGGDDDEDRKRRKENVFDWLRKGIRWAKKGTEWLRDRWDELLDGDYDDDDDYDDDYDDCDCCGCGRKACRHLPDPAPIAISSTPYLPNEYDPTNVDGIQDLETVDVVFS